MKTKKFVTENQNVLNHPAINDVLIYDIETDSLDVDDANVKFFGAYSYRHAKFFLIPMSERGAIQQLLDEHRILVGFNNKAFDGPILSNFKNLFNMDFKICFDCLTVLYDHERKRPNREVVIKHNGKLLAGLLPNRKLRTIAETLDFPVAKGDIDYNVFKLDSWTQQQLDEIYKYLYYDIELTRLLFEFYVDYFKPFSEYVPHDNIMKFNYIRSSLGSYAYSALCNLTGIPLEFETDPEMKSIRPPNDGGFVLPPQQAFTEGTIIYADFASLYPHIMFMCNLFCPTEDEDAWDGDMLFPDLQAKYNNKKLGPIEHVLKDIYMKRREYKQNKDPRELALKIMINTIYGLSGSPIFKSVFNMTTSGDCTYIGRTMINYTRHAFEERGFKVIYGDTDSIFIVLPKNKSVDDFRGIAKETMENILSNIPFPVDTFKLDIDDIFKKIWLFKKKMYIGLNHEDKFVIKGLPIIKHDASQLGQKMLKKLKPKILEQQSIKFSKEYLKQQVEEEIKKDLTVVARNYNVKDVNSYKALSSIQAQISHELGEGSHLLIPNKRIGRIGKTKKYCTLEEAKGLSIDDIYLDKVWSELDPFIA